MSQKNSFLVIFIVILAFIHTEKVNEKNEFGNDSSGSTEKNYIETSDIIFLGVNHFKSMKSYLAFNAYFAPISNYSIFSSLTFPIFIDYDTTLKESEEIDMKCSLQEIQTTADQKISYRCETNEIKTSINQINIIPNFNFIPNNNRNSPNKKNIPEKNNDDDNIMPYNIRNISYKNVSIYVVHNVSFTKFEKNKFLMNGRVSHEIPIYDYQPMILLAETTNDTDIELEGFIYKERILNYTVRCRSNVTETVELDGSIGFIDEENLLLYNFSEGIEHTIDLYVDKIKKEKNSGHIKAGMIVFLVIGIVLSIIAFIIALLLGQKKKSENYVEKKNDSEIIQINNIK